MSSRGLLPIAMLWLKLALILTFALPLAVTSADKGSLAADDFPHQPVIAISIPAIS